MASIELRNIGPIINTGELQLSQVLLITGKQSSGKSTLLKVLSFCSWIEKKIMLGDSDVVYQYSHYFRFLKELKSFHRLADSFFCEDSYIRYVGECVEIVMNGIRRNVRILKLGGFDGHRHNLKMSFIPSERNLVSAIKNVDRAYRSSDIDALFNHIFEWGEARLLFTRDNPKRLSVVDDLVYYYDKKRRADVLRMEHSQEEFSTFYASSGVQSALPIELIVEYAVNALNSPVDISQSHVQEILQQWLLNNKKKGNLAEFTDVVLERSEYKSVRFFIEEPEQNLYPLSQKDLIFNIVANVKRATNKTGIDSFVALTTHSPYVLSVINVLMKASEAFEKCPSVTREIISEDFILPMNSIRAYHINDGIVEDVLNGELQMVNGEQLDSLSDWTNDMLNALNMVVYGE